LPTLAFISTLHALLTKGPSMSNLKNEREREPYKRKLIADFPSGILLSVSVRDLEELERPERDADESDES
jgi:hypothetical protein